MNAQNPSVATCAWFENTSHQRISISMFSFSVTVLKKQKNCYKYSKGVCIILK
jgi:hypothetical protein